MRSLTSPHRDQSQPQTRGWAILSLERTDVQRYARNFGNVATSSRRPVMTSYDREVRSADGYYPTLSGFPDLRRRGCGSRPRNGCPLSNLFSGGEMGAPGMQVIQNS